MCEDKYRGFTAKEWHDMYMKEGHEVEQALGKALGYPELYPDVSDIDDGTICVGEHTPGTIAAEAASRIMKLRSQLPEGMQDCTIVFKQCAVGHGRLTATNWVQHGCSTCEIEKLKDKLNEAVQMKQAEEARADQNAAAFDVLHAELLEIDKKQERTEMLERVAAMRIPSSCARDPERFVLEGFCDPAKLDAEGNNPTPWVDCKIAFSTELSVDDFCDYLDEHPEGLPRGWAFDEYDDAGARAVVVFRVEGIPTKLDGEIVRHYVEKAAERS